MYNSYAFDTPLGRMQAHADTHALHFLGFIEDVGITQDPEGPLLLIEEELNAYFRGELKEFTTPIFLQGTPFQEKVWQSLRKIPFAVTKSYKEIAEAIENPLGSRAVGNANGANPFVIIIPCHRVVQADGSLGGYSSGLWRKQWLLDHERNQFLK